MIVIDASALSAFLLKEPGWRKLASYLTNALSIDHIVKEVSNSIWKALTKKLINEQEALQLHGLLNSLIGVNVIAEPEGKYVKEAFTIALKTGITVYDSLYIALAKERKLPLLTLDVRQGEAAKSVGVKIVTI